MPGMRFTSSSAFPDFPGMSAKEPISIVIPNDPCRFARQSDTICEREQERRHEHDHEYEHHHDGGNGSIGNHDLTPKFSGR